RLRRGLLGRGDSARVISHSLVVVVRLISPLSTPTPFPTPPPSSSPSLPSWPSAIQTTTPSIPDATYLNILAVVPVAHFPARYRNRQPYLVHDPFPRPVRCNDLDGRHRCHSTQAQDDAEELDHHRRECHLDKGRSSEGSGEDFQCGAEYGPKGGLAIAE
ncbi:hypothetical protein ACHAXS_004234, partial [Conticribra weissflogii]